jgi:hypothetical protein
MLSAACDGGPNDPKPEPVKPGIGIVAGAGTTDTVQATPVQALNVLVTGPDGKPAAGAPVLFESGFATLGGSRAATMTVGPVVSSTFTTSVGDTTDASGVASVRVRFGTIAGAGKVVVTVPTLGFQDTARYNVTPGAPTQTLIAPRDTAMYMAGSVTLHTGIFDRLGNRRPEAPTLSGPAALTISGNTVSTSTFGRHLVRASYPGTISDSTTVTALPRGRLAAASGYMGTSVVMMDLDGSNRVTAAVGGTIYGLDWAPDGRVVAGVGNSSTSTLQAVSASGEVKPFLTGSTAGSEAYPVFSADGKKVFFAGRNPGAFSFSNTLWHANADGTGVQATTLSLSFDWGTSYGPSPDGSRVVFQSSVYNVQTQARTTLSPTRISSWSWSPLGDLVAFNDYETMGVMKPDGTERRVFSSAYTGFSDRTIDWSGDGKYIVVRSSFGALDLLEVATGTRVMIPRASNLALAVLK